MAQRQQTDEKVQAEGAASRAGAKKKTEADQGKNGQKE